MKMRVAKTVHPLELARNLDRHKRLIFAALMSAVLIISIIFVGSFLLPGQSVSSDSYGYVEIFIERGLMWNNTIHGPRWYNITTDKGLITLQVTNITMDKATYLNMSLISSLDGRNLTMLVPNATATKLIVYTTYISIAGTEIFGYTNYTAPSPEYEPPPEGWCTPVINVRMKVVYMYAESFFAPQGLNLTFT